MTPHPTPPLRPYLLLYAAAAVWVAFSGIHALHNSDSFVFGLLSLDAYTPFFWEQDRVGMLVPLVASVVRDPLWNLVLQTGLTAFAGLCVPLLLAELIYPHPAPRIAATLANAIMLGLAPDRVRENLLFECCYPLAMALGCAALLVLGRGWGWPRWWRVVVAAVLLCLACWVYVGVPLWLGPLALVRGWLQPGEPWPPGVWRKLLRPAIHARTSVGCLLVVVGFGAGYGAMYRARLANPELVVPTPKDALHPSEWIDSWRAFLHHFERFPETTPWVATVVGCAGVGAAAALVRWKKTAVPIASGLVVLLVPAAAEFGYIGTRAWTAQNDHHPRYLLGSVECLQLACALLTVLPFAGYTARTRWPGAVAALLLFAAATAQFGWPSIGRPQQAIDRVAGQWTPELAALNVDAVGGGYWTTWPAVYHMNLTRRRSGDGRLFVAVTSRGEVLLARSGLRDGRPFRVAVWNDADSRATFLSAATNLKLPPPVKIGEGGHFEIYETRAATTP